MFMNPCTRYYDEVYMVCCKLNTHKKHPHSLSISGRALYCRIFKIIFCKMHCIALLASYYFIYTCSIMRGDNGNMPDTGGVDVMEETCVVWLLFPFCYFVKNMLGFSIDLAYLKQIFVLLIDYENNNFWIESLYISRSICNNLILP